MIGCGVATGYYSGVLTTYNMYYYVEEHETLFNLLDDFFAKAAVYSSIKQKRHSDIVDKYEVILRSLILEYWALSIGRTLSPKKGVLAFHLSKQVLQWRCKMHNIGTYMCLAMTMTTPCCLAYMTVAE